jgi:hypothetical protein
MRLIFAALLVVMCGVASAHAESGASPATEAQSPAASGGPDFLFGRPNAWIALSGTWLVPRAGGDLFTFVRDQLTLSPSDFRTPAFTTAFGVALPRRLEVVGDIEISKHAVPSEYRKYVKADRSSITQTTQFDQAALGAGVRYLPLGRGQTISRYAFVPRRIVPFVGAGASFVHYTFQQRGEFVDFVDLSIFAHSFRSTGWSVGPHVDGGADLQIWRMFFLDVAARYTWAHSALSRDFEGFDGIDLAGFKSSTGITIVF